MSAVNLNDQNAQMAKTKKSKSPHWTDYVPHPVKKINKYLMKYKVISNALKGKESPVLKWVHDVANSLGYGLIPQALPRDYVSTNWVGAPVPGAGTRRCSRKTKRRHISKGTSDWISYVKQNRHRGESWKTALKRLGR